MALLYGSEWNSKDLLERVGNISQLGGIRLIEYADGAARGMRAADIRSGSGLAFTVLLDRGMDIGPAEFAGCPLAWNSCVPLKHPAYFRGKHKNWLQSFGGGLLTTCGLSNAGAPNRDGDEDLGLHGSFSGIPAENVKTDQTWNKEDLDFSIEGTMRESAVFGPNLSLQRLVWTRLGEKKIFIEDCVTNNGFEERPLMLLYHINIGWPLLDADTILIMPTGATTLMDPGADSDPASYKSFQTPVDGYSEKVYFHNMIPDSAGYIQTAVVNPNLNSLCFGLYIKYPQRELPCMTQWKMLGKGHYVLGIEPGNCTVLGRSRERELGRLEILKPGQTRKFHLEIGVITTPEELDQISDQVNNLLGRR
ncbi:MAG TPA: aldose 1-epimerase family protein [Candidatus Sumerlaeota bacterium]|nr:aldose 1-epimerase family protein [Candidatus Sumerlaeota bacterium]